MKALTLWQPWASLMALGEKHIETRCWKTDYRGDLAIHAAAKRPPHWLGRSAQEEEFRNELADVLNCRSYFVEAEMGALPRGVVLCVVRLTSIEETAHVREITPTRERIFGNYDDGRYAWNTEIVEVFDPPIPAKGNRLLWNWEQVTLT